MRRRLIVSTALIALTAVLVLGIPLGIVEARRAHSDATARLEREADAVAAAVDDRIEARRPIRAADLRRFVRSGHRVVIDDRGQRVVIGHIAAGATLDVGSGLAHEARVTASAPQAEVGRRVRNIWLLVFALGVGGIAAAVALAGLQARRLARPLERLARTSAQLGTGDFSARAGHFGIPEIDDVAAALDASAARIARLLGREREFSANVSHQLRTPLTGLRLRLEELASLRDPDLVAHEASGALAEADRLERTIAELLAAARSGRTGEPGELDLDDLVRRHVTSWRPTFAGEGRTLRIESSGAPMRASATAGSVGQALDVLLENALRHGAGIVTVTVARHRDQPCIRVEDEGEGIAAGSERKIFERGGSLGGGTGIGLPLARTLIESDGGRLVLVRRQPATLEIVLQQVPARVPVWPTAE